MDRSRQLVLFVSYLLIFMIYLFINYTVNVTQKCRDVTDGKALGLKFVRKY